MLQSAAHEPVVSCIFFSACLDDLNSFMDGEAKLDALCIAAIIGIAGNLEKLCVTAKAKVHSLDSSLFVLQSEIKPAPETLTQKTDSLEVDTRNLPAFSDLISRFTNEEAKSGKFAVSAQDRWNTLRAAKLSALARGENVSSESLGDSTPIFSLPPAVLDPSFCIGLDSEISHVHIAASLIDPVRTERVHITTSQPQRRALVAEENSTDQQQDDQVFNSILAAQTVTASVTFTEESRRVESGQKASLALRPNVVLLKLAPPAVSAPRFGFEGWLHSEGDLVISRTHRPSDANGNKLSEDQYYKYVNIDPSALDAHVRACYRVYFGEQVSVSRPSGRNVPSGSDHQVLDETLDTCQDILAWARSRAKKSFLPYSSWQKNSYVNLETSMNSNDPFETTRSDPRTRLLIQFQSLQMKLLEHPDFRGVEPLFATAFLYSTGKNVGRRVRCVR